MKRRVLLLVLAAAFVGTGCTQSDADSQPPRHKPSSNQNPDYDAR